jgi:arylsulfatase A-like enzyme
MYNDIQLLTDNGLAFGQVLRDAGYRMGYVGKWHLYGGDRDRPIPPGPHRHGFDGVFLSNNCHVNYTPGQCYYWNEAGAKAFFPEWEVFGQTRQALEFLDGASEAQPFALFVSWHPPHDNGRTKEGVWRYETIPELMNLYDPEKIRFRPNFDSTVHDKRSYHGHMAMCSGVDMAFGWLMEKLREKGLEENTLVVFTSDHGDLLGSNRRPWPKGFPEDGSVRVPLLLRWPGRLAAGRVSELLVGTLDLMPTLLALLGLSVPETCQGQDLSAHIAAGRDDAVASVPLFLVGANWRGVYTPRYTYSTCPVENPKFSFRVLYDKQADPFQMRNLYDDPGSQPQRTELQRLTEEWLARFEDRFVTIDRVNRVCFANGKAPGMTKGETGLLLGRPLDRLRAAGL